MVFTRCGVCDPPYLAAVQIPAAVQPRRDEDEDLAGKGLEDLAGQGVRRGAARQNVAEDGPCFVKAAE
jgi:hypothetical protein